MLVTRTTWVQNIGRRLQEEEVGFVDKHHEPGVLDLLRTSGPVDWDAILNRVQKFPSEVVTCRNDRMQSNGDSSHPLHLALATRPYPPAPLVVIKALIKADCDAVFTCNSIGFTPLYCACLHQAGNETVQLLLNENPGAAMQPERYYHKIPLHVAKDAGVVKMLLDVFPDGVGMKDRRGQLPIHKAAQTDVSPEIVHILMQNSKLRNLTDADVTGGIMVRDIEDKTPLDYVCDRITQRSKRDPAKNTLLPLDAEGMNYWDKLNMMVEVASCHNIQQNSQLEKIFKKVEIYFLIVHSVLDLSCPPEVIFHSLRMNPQQMSEQDHRGRTPLMIAAANKGISPDVISYLLHPEEGFPCAAKMKDFNGRLPLHYAAWNGREVTVIKNIIEAAPLALQTRDEIYGFFPFMLAAASENGSIEVVFTLLREAPTTVSML